MRTHLLSMFFLILPLSLLCNSLVDTNLNSEKVENLQNRVDSLEIEIRDLHESKNRSKKIIQHSTKTIENQQSLIDSFGVIYSILTIIIAFVSIGFPVLTYFIGIKPSRDALKDLENNLDQKVADYLHSTRKQQIKNSIEYLKGENPELKSQAVSFLALTQHEGFSDQELFEFYRLIKSGKLNDSYIGTIAHLLGSRVNEYADELFSDKEMLQKNVIKPAAYQYFFKAGIDNFIKPLKEFLENQNDQVGELISLLAMTNMHSPEITKKLLNNKEIIDCFNKENLTQLANFRTQSPDHQRGSF